MIQNLRKWSQKLLTVCGFDIVIRDPAPSLLSLVLSRFSAQSRTVTFKQKPFVYSISLKDNSEYLEINTDKHHSYRAQRVTPCLVTSFAIFLHVQDHDQNRFRGWILKASIGNSNFRRLSRWVHRWKA